jgi:hypothetical protein
MRFSRAFAPLALFLIACGGGGGQQTVRKPDPLEHAPPPDSRLEAHDDGMTVEGTTGVLDDADVRAVIDSQMGGFRNCFQQQQSSSYVSGEVLLDFVVRADGRVDRVWVAQSDLGSWRVEDCLVTTAKYLEFPPPQGGGRARFAFPFAWNQAGARLSAPVEQAWGYPTLRAQREAIRACRKAHDFTGPFHLTVYVGRLGRVLAVGFDSATAPDELFPACVAQTVEGLTFPDPGQRTVKYRALVEDFPDV